MKKITAVLLVTLMTAVFALTGCGPVGGDPDNGGGTASIDDGETNICLLINGNLGDMSFFDSANAGMTKFRTDNPGVKVDIVEMGTDNSRWEPTLRQTADNNYDLIIVGTTEMREPLQRLVKNARYSDRRFVIFDTEIEDNKAANYSTVHSILFKQNEGGFLAGALAGYMTTAQGSDRTAFIGGMQIDIINDFGYGFMQGLKQYNTANAKTLKAYNSYIGDFSNSPKGKSLADTAYSNGVEILFAAASQAGLGCLDSAKNKNKYIIGVDSDQYEYFKSSDPSKADKIVTSVLKRVDLTLYEACEAFVAGTLTYGDLTYVGLADGKIGLADNERYRAAVPESTRNAIDALRAAVIDGSIDVASGLKRYTPLNTVLALYDEMKP
ncbi:MAG: BMP family ABC transporter substrate-binding protein [Clostridiales bacterium]|jgi:basic membrane protein A|nr:BMP family ABC transporter substrate-binding protein [Clostridiales bacterium]